MMQYNISIMILVKKLTCISCLIVISMRHGYCLVDAGTLQMLPVLKNLWLAEEGRWLAILTVGNA